MTATHQDQSLCDRILKLSYSGRIIDHLGLQMYQSPVAAIAEIVANAWDADADTVEISLPGIRPETAEIMVKDNGIGMSFADCQTRFLNVGYARRGIRAVETSPRKQRRILGRKGIGKFAGFGIAQVIRVETVSHANGERTVFEMDLAKLRTDDYVNREGTEIDLIEYQGPDVNRQRNHGTTMRLRRLALRRRPNPESFAQSMARRFLLHQTAVDFRVSVNGAPLVGAEDLLPVQFTFPTEYRDQERPADLCIDEDWGLEAVDGQRIRWRVRFYCDPIGEEELRGLSVFAGVKMVQAPFFFNLSGGLPGQHGQQYISGQIQADFLDEQDTDLVAPERQRVNWNHPVAAALEEWGGQRLKQLLGIWRDRRGEARQQQLEDRVAGFAERIQRLHNHERKTVIRALRQVAQIETLSQGQFEDLGNAMLIAWEQGRLHDLIDGIAQSEDLTSDELVQILAEAQVLTALNTAEAVKTKILTVSGLRQRIDQKELENAIRDYISEHPWLISPKWETFAVETGIRSLTRKALAESGITAEDDFRGRVDLTLSSGDHLLILEFMRPGKPLDWNHLNRFEQYVLIVRATLESNTGSPFRRTTGYIVADSLDTRMGMREKIRALEQADMFALDWPTLFANAIKQWQDFLTILAERDPPDERLKALAADQPVLTG